jgi:hypothetical protein
MSIPGHSDLETVVHKVAPDGFCFQVFQFLLQHYINAPDSFIYIKRCIILAMTVWLVTRTFVSSIKSNKQGPRFVEDMLIIEIHLLKYICFVEKHYSVKASVLKHRPIWRSICISVYQIQFLLY